MKVLWFEVTVPSAYKNGGVPLGGWQDSLERIVRTVPEIELIIAFMSETNSEVKVIDGVTYVPIYSRWSYIESRFLPYWDVYVKKMLPAAREIVETYKPDLIQVFGIEWPFGQIAAYTEIPVVIHLMGAIVPYNNALYPPGYSYREELQNKWFSPRKFLRLLLSERDKNNREEWERKTWQLVRNYMGRTQWDESLSRLLHPGRSYFHVEEALRLSFINGNKKWALPVGNKIRLISTGCSTFWKGPDMMLKVAKILTSLQLDFEWLVAGNMNSDVKAFVESKEGVFFSDCHVTILGFIQPDELMNILCSSMMYVHTAYIENSPNSICEAQCLGVPVISTNVGGISSLIRDGIDGILVPANDPWQMADAIIRLAADKALMLKISEQSSSLAKRRHDDEHIKQQLLDVYRELLTDDRK